MRIIFVGMHNKPVKTPLCSSTKSGKTIDRIIEQLQPFSCVKTNLYDVDEYPSMGDEKYRLAKEWVDRVNPHENDIVVLLGAEVHENNVYKSKNIVKLPHPAGMFYSNKKTDYYVDAGVEKIRYAIGRPLPKEI